MDFIIFAIAHILAVLSPGPVFIGLTNLALESGFKKAVLFALGIALGNIIFSLIAIFGLSKFIFEVKEVTIGFYLFGGVFLIIFGIKLFFKKKRDSSALKIDSTKTFFTGLLIELSNPKSLFFTVNLIALFVKPESSPTLKAFTVFWLVVVSFLYEIMIAWLFSIHREKVLKWLLLLNKIFSFLLIGFGIRLIFFGMQTFNSITVW